MSKQANKTLIGGFVVGAVALAMAGVLIFGSGWFLTEKTEWVLYFEGSLKGLNVGAPVLFRGVKLGSVTDIKVLADPKTYSIQIPVFIEMEPDRFSLVGGRTGAAIEETERRKGVEQLIERGLRAQLELQSMVTGLLQVALDFHPDKPLRLVGDGTVRELPTVPSDIEELASRIKKLSLDQLVAKLTSAIGGIERAVNSPEVAESITNLNQVLKDTHKLVQNVNSRIEPLASGLERTVGDYGKLAKNLDKKVSPLTSGMEETIRDAQKLVRNVDGRIGPLASSIKRAAKAATAALAQGEKTLSEIEGVSGEDSAVIYQLNNALEELSAAARSIRVWADYLERHPEALLRGKRR